MVAQKKFYMVKKPAVHKLTQELYMPAEEGQDPVLIDLGHCTPDEIKKLKAAGVIADPPAATKSKEA